MLQNTVPPKGETEAPSGMAADGVLCEPVIDGGKISTPGFPGGAPAMSTWT